MICIYIYNIHILYVIANLFMLCAMSYIVDLHFVHIDLGNCILVSVLKTLLNWCCCHLFVFFQDQHGYFHIKPSL